ncbi:MAG: DUF4397 domain-containing protein [Chitinophagaceae bacterium]|nr:DUF4397 domain-containing protein [Chitinophagaceae bacterium]
MRLERISFKAVVVILFPAVIVSACKKDKSSSPPPPEEKKKSFIQVVNATPKTGELEVSLDNKTIVAKVAYHSQPNSYVQFEPKDNIPFKITGPDKKTIAEGKYTFDKDKYYTVFAYDTLSTDKKVKYIILKDTLPDPGTGKSSIRFLHLSPDASLVNIDIFKGTDSLRLVTGGSYIGSTPNTVALSNFSKIAAGDYRVKVKGKTKTGADTLLLNISPVKVEAGKTFTLYLGGLVKGKDPHKISVQLLQHKK